MEQNEPTVATVEIEQMRPCINEDEECSWSGDEGCLCYPDPDKWVPVAESGEEHYLQDYWSSLATEEAFYLPKTIKILIKGDVKEMPIEWLLRKRVEVPEDFGKPKPPVPCDLHGQVLMYEKIVPEEATAYYYATEGSDKKVLERINGVSDYATVGYIQPETPDERTLGGILENLCEAPLNPKVDKDLERIQARIAEGLVRSVEDAQDLLDSVKLLARADKNMPISQIRENCEAIFKVFSENVWLTKANSPKGLSNWTNDVRKLLEPVLQRIEESRITQRALEIERLQTLDAQIDSEQTAHESQDRIIEIFDEDTGECRKVNLGKALDSSAMFHNYESGEEEKE